MKLRDLLGQDILGDDAAIAPAVAALDVSGLALDSRVVKQDDLFFALAGSKTDGVRFIDAAIAAGAVAVVGDHAPAACQVPFIAVANPRRALALAAARFFPAQPATIAAVTGTSG
ncbi:Mur ligase domain-containing protein, partial [Bradyrhizobium guangdongense]|uniref:Mur ligase domain-containing protein n=1 Tax=Bradyrhizobium guangdongense TaxID=1325090 RepID=UPI001FD87F0C